MFKFLSILKSSNIKSSVQIHCGIYLENFIYNNCSQLVFIRSVLNETFLETENNKKQQTKNNEARCIQQRVS